MPNKKYFGNFFSGTTKSPVSHKGVHFLIDAAAVSHKGMHFLRPLCYELPVIKPTLFRPWNLGKIILVILLYQNHI